MKELLYMYVGFGLLLCALSIPLIRNKIKPNVFYGFRVPRTLNNPRIWYATNSYAGKRLLVSGLVTVIAAVGLYFIPGISVDGYTIGVSAAVAACFAVTIIQSWMYLRSLPDE